MPWAERLCVELLLDAERLGARVLTYTTVTGLIVEDQRVLGVRTRDRSGHEGRIWAPLTVNAAGPWIDNVLDGQVDSRRLNGGTKGSHVILDPFPGAPDTCIFFEAAATSARSSSSRGRAGTSWAAPTSPTTVISTRSSPATPRSSTCSTRPTGSFRRPT
ncbi:FAD-dependent oxidoreductase [Micromonospora sp. ATA32]|nr:FAD-dependent oxidoreductase [Micromonospora sp. ATA32]